MTHEDLDQVKALWEEWTAGKSYDLTVQVIGEHQPATMDLDRPLGAVLTAKLSLRVIVEAQPTVRNGVDPGGVVFDQPCPYDVRALKASVRAIARVIGESG